jgi:hypothetical protein
VCVQVLQGGKFLRAHHSQNANLNHFRILCTASTNHIIGTSVFPLFGFHTPTACCAALCSPGPWTDTHLLGSWAKNRSKLLLAAAATPNQDRTPTFLLSTRPCLPVAVTVISISSRPRFTHRHLSFVEELIASSLSHPVLSHITSRARDSRSRIIHDSIHRRSVGRSLDGEHQIRFTSPRVGGSPTNHHARKASVDGSITIHAHCAHRHDWQTRLSSPNPASSRPRLSPFLPFASLGIDVFASLGTKISALALLTGPVSS